MGTPAYMAPEQLRGERATAASDQFAFCVALWRAAYGAPPFPTDDLKELLRSVAEDTPAPPRKPEVHAWLAPILRRGLAKDPAARFPSIEALLAELGRHLPRDPEHDPALVRRERRILAGVFFLCSVVIWAYLFLRGAWQSLPSAADLVRIAAGLFAAGLVAVTLLRRRLAKNAYGRRVAALVLTAVAAMLAHRMVGWRTGMSVPQTLVGDEIILAAVYATAAVNLERWLGWLAGLMLAGAAVGAYEPAWALQAFAICAFGSTTTLLAVWGRRA
jgi:serine/threonine-protein kinase